MSQEQLVDLQRRLDEKLIDPKNLTLGQRNALDDAFKQGVLKGYGSVGDMINERRGARKELAAEVRSSLEPLKPTGLLSLGVRRAVLATIGDLTGSFTPYFLDGKKLAKEARELALAGKGVTYVPELRRDAGQKAFTGFSKALSLLPGLKQLGLFKKTTQVLDSAVNTSKALAAGNFTLSQFAKTELKSQALGATGAAAGSVTYDLINLPAKFVAAAGEDLSKYDQNEFNRLPFGERVAINAVKELYHALAWNAGAFGLVQTLRGTFGAAGRFFDLNPANVAKMNEKINEQGIGLSSLNLGSGVGGAPSIFKAANKIGNVFLAPAGEVSKAQQKNVAEAFFGIEGNLRGALQNAPLLHQEALATVMQSTIRKTYNESGDLYGSLYKQHENMMNAPQITLQKYTNKMFENMMKNGTYKNIIGDPLQAVFTKGFDMPFLATTNLRKTTDDILNIVQQGTSAEALARTRYNGLYDAGNDITIRTAQEINTRLKELEVKNGGGFVTPRQFSDLLKLWNSNYSQTQIKGSKADQIWLLREAFEQDFNYISKEPIEEILKTNGKLKNAYEKFKENLGPEDANNFLKEFREGVTLANTKLQEANYAFGQSVNFYNSAKVAKIARQADPAIFAAKGGVEFFREGNITNIQAMNNLFGAAINPKSGNKDSVENLFKMLGGGKQLPGEDLKQFQNRSERAQYVLRLINYRKIFDAFNQNAVIRNSNVTGRGPVLGQPFEEKGVSGVDEIIQILKEKQNPVLKSTTEDLLKREFGLGYEGLKLSPENMIQFERRALTPEVIQSALKDNIPINQTLFIKREAEQGFTEVGKLGRLGGFKEIGKKPLEPYAPDTLKLIQTAKQAQVTEGGVTRDISRAERKEALDELENLTYRMRGFQGFNADKLADELGLTTPTGREQLIKMFELGNGMNAKAAKSHVDNLEVIFEALKKQFGETPAGDPATFAVRSAIIGGGIGFMLGPAGAAGGSLIGAVMFGLLLKGGAHILNTPRIAKAWVDIMGSPVYSKGELMDINTIRSLSPQKRSTFADMFNFIFSSDEDAPKVSPNDIDEERIIKYLQGPTKTSVPTDKGIYNAIPENIKEKFAPERIKLNQIKGETKKDFNTFMQGSQVASFRENLLDNLDTEKGAAIASQPRVAEFIQNPMDLRVPEGAKTMQPNISQVTSDVYSGLFPGDSIGTTIAQSQQPRPPMMKKGGFVNVKNY